MLAKIAPRFVISRVIQNSYYANYMAVELVKEIIGQNPSSFYFEDPKKYFECNFYGFIASQTAPTQFADQFEAEKYQEAVNKFKVYNDVKAIVDRLQEFTTELRELYSSVESSNTSSNFFARPVQTDPFFESDLADALDRYHNFLDALEPYPEWKDKTVEEVGKWFHMIHNNLAESDAKRKLFSNMNRQEYFV